MFNKATTLALLFAGASANDKKHMPAEIMQGITTAYGGHFNLEALLDCIGEEDKAALVFDAAYQIFTDIPKEKDTGDKIGDLIGGVIFTFAGIQQVEQGLPACKAIDPQAWDYKSFKKAEKMFESPLKYMDTIENDVKINGVSIMEDIIKANELYGQGKYEQFGEELGKIIKKATEGKTQQHVDKKDIAKFASGFLEATKVGKFNFTALLECIYEADQAAEALDMGVRELIKGVEDKDINDIIPGVIGLVAFVQTLRQTIPLCETVDPKAMDWTTFDNIVATVEDPVNHMQALDKDIMMNGKKITSEINEGISAWQSGDYQTFGSSLGTTLKDTCEVDQLFLF
jgi:hypothetical protein